MKKGIYTLVLLSIGLLAANAQADYQMYLQIMLEPMLDQISLFEKNLAEHTKKSHTEGFREARVWTISSGSNSGKYAWVMGPLTFSDFDGSEPNKAHDEDWNNNVLALCSDVSEFNSNSNRDVAFGNSFQTWASLDEKSTFKKDIEEVHGEGSWGAFLEEYRASYNSYEDELSFLEPKLSGVEKE